MKRNVRVNLPACHCLMTHKGIGLLQYTTMKILKRKLKNIIINIILRCYRESLLIFVIKRVLKVVSQFCWSLDSIKTCNIRFILLENFMFQVYNVNIILNNPHRIQGIFSTAHRLTDNKLRCTKMTFERIIEKYQNNLIKIGTLKLF